MGPFPHDAPKAVVSVENPAGTDGFEFVELMAKKTRGLEGLFEQIGLQ